jgi:cobalt-zinc-cadmium efflux system membrane fusion protein
VIEDQALVQLQQDYLMAKSRMQLTKLDLERQQSLNETKTAADKVLQQATAEYEGNRLMVLGLAEKLRLININPEKLTGNSISRKVNIVSPIDGFVSKVNVNIGKYVQPQDVLFELINPTDMHAALTVFEKDINKIKNGQKVNVSFVDEPGKIYEAEVILVTRNVDENRSGVIHCHFDKIPDNLIPGMYIQGTVILSNNTVNALPESAIVRFENQEFIFLQKETFHFVPFPITTGTKNEGWIEVQGIDSTKLKDSLVVKNAFTVLSAWKNSEEE